MSDFDKARDEAAVKYDPEDSIGDNRIAFEDGADWAKQYLDAETEQLRASLKLAVEALECKEPISHSGVGRFGEDFGVDVPCRECKACKAIAKIKATMGEG
jgi:hypothetical protein